MSEICFRYVIRLNFNFKLAQKANFKTIFQFYFVISCYQFENQLFPGGLRVLRFCAWWFKICVCFEETSFGQIFYSDFFNDFGLENIF